MDDGGGAITIDEAKQRAALLAGNPELKILFEKLVLTGAITENEFWESRKVGLTLVSLSL